MSYESVTKNQTQVSDLITPLAPRRTTLRQQAFQCVLAALFGAISYFVISHFIFQNVQVVGESMVPTLYDSQQYLLNRLVYLFREPKRTDVVVLKDPQEHSFAVKRIIATAGDRVDLRAGKVYVNGCALHEPYLLPNTPTWPYFTKTEDTIFLGKDQYFVLGDNRNNSADSRTYGPVPRRSILGMIMR